tara:strand:- start:138 stop:605 length:468 start_codon:yes stop_codon:yes gene_type:complete
MKKLLAIIVLGLMLVGCARNYSLFKPFVEEEFSGGGEIWIHGTLNTFSGRDKVDILAENNCKSRRFAGAEVVGGGKGEGIYGEFRTYEFKCISLKQDEVKSAISMGDNMWMVEGRPLEAAMKGSRKHCLSLGKKFKFEQAITTGVAYPNIIFKCI